MPCTTMDRDAAHRPADARDEEIGHRRLVRALVAACLVGGTWLAAQDMGLHALDVLLR